MAVIAFAKIRRARGVMLGVTAALALTGISAAQATQTEQEQTPETYLEKAFALLETHHIYRE